MKHMKKILILSLLAVLIVSVLCVPALAITESEVEAQVAATSKAEVSGNVLIWFLCAMAFLKVSQKVDSFMASLGVNVGHTGGSLLAEAMIAVRSVTMVTGKGRGAGRSNPAAGSSEKSASSGMAGFFKGGLIGMAGRHITNSAVRTATAQTSAVHTTQSQVQRAASASAPTASSVSAAQTAADTRINTEVHPGGSSVHTQNDMGNSTPSGMPPQEGVVLTGSEGPIPAPAEHTPPSVPVPAPEPPHAEHTPPATPAPDTPLPPQPQEGTILTGSETPAPLPDSPQTADMPPENTTYFMPPPPQDGTVLAGTETPFPPPQPVPELHGGSDGAVFRESTTVVSSKRQSGTHTERASQTTQTGVSKHRTQSSHTHTGAASPISLGGMVFSKSLASGGQFANDVIGTVARGEVAGSITGDLAVQSLTSYMGYPVIGSGPEESPHYSDVEIGRGRITGTETPAGSSTALPFAMYHVDQYIAPSGDYTKIFTADGTQWYKQYAQDAVEHKPYKAPDDTVAYHERIIKKLPDPPKRKDRI